MTVWPFPRYQKLWKSYVKLRHLLANSPKVKQTDKQKLAQREVGIKPAPWRLTVRAGFIFTVHYFGGPDRRERDFKQMELLLSLVWCISCFLKAL